MSDRDELRSILNRLHGEGGHGWIERAAERLTIITDRQEAECGRLREQLDAARQALTRIAALDGHPTVPPPDYGDFAVAIARAALGVEGEQEKP